MFAPICLFFSTFYITCSPSLFWQPTNEERCFTPKLFKQRSREKALPVISSTVVSLSKQTATTESAIRGGHSHERLATINFVATILFFLSFSLIKLFHFIELSLLYHPKGKMAKEEEGKQLHQRKLHLITCNF